MIEKGALVPLYRNIRIPVVDHIVVPVPSATRRNFARCYRLEKIERKCSFKCATCNKTFCFGKVRNCLLLDHPKTLEKEICWGDFFLSSTFPPLNR